MIGRETFELDRCRQIEMVNTTKHVGIDQGFKKVTGDRNLVDQGLRNRGTSFSVPAAFGGARGMDSSRFISQYQLTTANLRRGNGVHHPSR